MKRRLGQLALLAGALLFSLAAAEGLYRWTLRGSTEEARDDGQWRARYRRMNETIYRRSADPLLVYEPRPGSAVEMEYGPAGFNSAGMRDDREVPRAHQRGEGARRRVALLGDSLVWGEFLALEDGPARRLEEALGPEGQEVLNFGVSGYDTAQEARWYEAAVRPFSPDVLVLVYCMNDMMIMSGPYNRFATEAEQQRKEAQDRQLDRLAPVRRETLDRVARAEEEAATIRLLARARSLFRRLTFDTRYVDEYTVMAGDPARVEAVGAALGRLGASLADDGVRAILVLSPVLESWSRYHWSAIHQQVAGAGRAAGFEVLDLLEGWRGAHDPAELRFPGDNLHYNRRGARLLGEAIAAAIRQERP